MRAKVEQKSVDTIVFQIAGLCCLLVVLMAYFFESFQRRWLGFHLTILLVAALVATPMSMTVLHQHFALWIVDFIVSSSHRVSPFQCFGVIQ